MEELQPLGRLLLVAGLVLAIAGGLLMLGPRIPFLGQLPGDIRIERENLVLFIPLGTMLVVSLLLTIVLNVLNRR